MEQMATITNEPSKNLIFAKNLIRLIRQEDLATVSKTKYKKANESDIEDLIAGSKIICSSWRDKFLFKEEDKENNVVGLRPPQIGAVHAAIAHWKVSNSPATIVIPTGIGKTETMMSLVVSQSLSRVLVIVPSDALREQISNKFLKLGILKQIGAIKEDTQFPIVGTLKHSFISQDEVKKYFDCCNIVVTTMGVINNCSKNIQKSIAENCNNLFIDEAHHVSANTWSNFKESFKEKRILQFTATPFRNDGKFVDGKIIFDYPLKKAQEEGYFKLIDYKPIFEYNPKNVDKAIATKAIKQLRSDIKKGYDHILMARVDDIDRANKVFLIYKKYKEFNPVQIHTGIKSKKERETIRQNIINKKSRIIVCVDMFGEGFDLPELKIAAFHDIKKSLPVTLQLVGRFTRSRSDLGNPTFIANAADINVSDELKKLYSQGADWNILLSQDSGKVTKEQIDLWEFLEGFKKFPDEIPLQNIRPAMSTVIYKTKCLNWTPDDWINGFKGTHFDVIKSDISQKNNTLVIVTARSESVSWAQIKDVNNWNWDLYIVFWDKNQKLLFINSSSNQGYFENLAKAIAGNDVNLIRDFSVFRCFSQINRLKLQNVGLIEQLGRLIRYTMRSGPDVESGLTESQIRTVKKANIFGMGYENGQKTSIGCSYKGRIWSRRTTNVEYFTKWCQMIGKKVLDTSINPDKVLEGTLIPTYLSKRPNKFPVFIDWPEVLYEESENDFEIIINDRITALLSDTDIKLKNPSIDGDLSFEITTDDFKVEVLLDIYEKDGQKNYRYSIKGEDIVVIKHRNSKHLIEEFFNNECPSIWFNDGSELRGNSYTEIKYKYPPYPIEKIETWDWTGVDIQKESQKITREKDSIQYYLIEKLKNNKFDVIFDDDGSGEVGDVITIKDNGSILNLDIYHCKFSTKPTPGGRIEDLYTVCGQAQKSVGWIEDSEKLLKHMLRRNAKRLLSSKSSRFVVGNNETIQELIMKATRYPLKTSIFIVQPGLSKEKITKSQLELLAVTENYLLETYKLPFGVIASK